MPGASAKRPELKVFWTSQAKQDREFWGKHDRRALVRIEKPIADMKEHPFIGIGKPEPLRHEWSEYWSRRITKEHRLIYRVESGILCPVPFSLRLREESRQKQRKPIPNRRTRQKM